MSAIPVMAFPIARKALEAILMAERQDDGETDFIKWATLNQEVGNILSRTKNRTLICLGSSVRK